MLKNSLENKIKDKLQNYSAPVDTSALWNELESEVPKPKKRKRFVLFIWLTLGLSLAVSLYALMTVKKAQKDIAEVRSHLRDEHLQYEGLNSNLGDASKAMVSESLRPTSNLKALQKEASVMPTEQEKAISPHVEQEHTLNSGNVNPLKPKTSVAVFLPINPIPTFKNIIELPLRQEKMALPQLPNVKVAKLFIDPDLPFIKTSEISNARWRWGIDFGLYTLASSSTNKGANYKYQWREAYQANLTVSRQIAPKLFLKGGFHYEALHHELDYSNQYVEEEIVEGVSTIVIDSRGETTEQNGQVIQSAAVEHKGIYHSYLDLIDVSLGAEYEWLNKGAWSLWSDVGMSFNIGQFSKGTSVDEEGLLYQWNGKNRSVYDQFSPRIDAGLSMSYDVNAKMGFYGRVNTSYRSFLQQVGGDKATHSFLMPGLQVGAYWKM